MVSGKKLLFSLLIHTANNFLETEYFSPFSHSHNFLLFLSYPRRCSSGGGGGSRGDSDRCSRSGCFHTLHGHKCSCSACIRLSLLQGGSTERTVSHTSADMTVMMADASHRKEIKMHSCDLDAFSRHWYLGQFQPKIGAKAIDGNKAAEYR